MEGPIIPLTGLAWRAGAPCCAHGFAQMSPQNSDRRLPAHPDAITITSNILDCYQCELETLNQGLGLEALIDSRQQELDKKEQAITKTKRS